VLLGQFGLLSDKILGEVFAVQEHVQIKWFSTFEHVVDGNALRSAD